MGYRLIPSAGIFRPTVIDKSWSIESKVRVGSQSLDPIDSIDQLLSITVGRNIPAEGIGLKNGRGAILQGSLFKYQNPSEPILVCRSPLRRG